MKLVDKLQKSHEVKISGCVLPAIQPVLQAANIKAHILHAKRCIYFIEIVLSSVFEISLPPVQQLLTGGLDILIFTGLFQFVVSYIDILNLAYRAAFFTICPFIPDQFL